MNKTEEQSGMTMEQMEEAGKIEEKKRDAEAAVAQSEAASKKRREGKRVRVPVRFKKPLDSSSPNYRNLTLAMERDGFAEPLVEGSYPSFEVLIYEDDLELLDKFCGVKGLDILDHRMEELPELRSATTIVGDFSLELLLKAIREANPGCFVTGKQVHGKFENVPGKTVIVLRPAGCRSVADVMRCADVSLSPGWTECFASEVGPMEDPSGMLLMRHVLWRENVAADSVKAGQGQPGYCFELSWNGVDGSSNACIRTKTSERMGRLVVTLGPVKGSTVKPGPLTPAVPAGAGEEGPLATQTSPSGTRKPRWGQPQEGGKPRRRGQPQGIAGRHRLGGGWTRWRKPQEGDNLKKEENPAVGDNLKGHRWATSAGWGRTRRRKTPRGQPQEGGNPAEGDNLMREGAEENPDFGENLDGGMEDDAGDGNAAGWRHRGHTTWLRWLGLASFCLRDNVRLGTWKV
ncbi:hypothetical protein PAPYR_10886 [Paratrimastix pyriformis]|uniref:Uncharacterized protein n=1 Tax=Paratrimastix pyriformis TaxID=342808 RepID=A0ABQ8U503_9EUKA|nr:hypothetical protein PAPYR_10886 [Paratrimastix pyriformis]